MKKLLLSILAIAAITACSKSEVVYNEPAEIGIRPVAQNITKAMLTDTEFPNEQFNLWAWYKPLNQGTTIDTWQTSTETQQTYINEKTFKQTTDNTKLWGGVTPYYWPKMGSLLFAGYYPTSIAEKVEYTFSSEKNEMTITDYTPGMVTTATTYTEDLMYFNMTPTSYDSSTQSTIDVIGNNVDVVFRHALSWISVVLVKETNTPDNAVITVNSVKFTDILPQGDAVVNNSPAQNETNEIVWTAEGDAASIEVCPDDDTETEAKKNVVTLAKGNTEPLAKQPILIPQTMDGKKLIVNYTITSQGDGSAFTETKEVALSGMEGTTGAGDAATTASLTAWQPAKHYTYTITIGTTEILIDPAVEAWTGVAVNLPIQ